MNCPASRTTRPAAESQTERASIIPQGRERGPPRTRATTADANQGTLDTLSNEESRAAAAATTTDPRWYRFSYLLQCRGCNTLTTHSFRTFVPEFRAASRWETKSRKTFDTNFSSFQSNSPQTANSVRPRFYGHKLYLDFISRKRL